MDDNKIYTKANNVKLINTKTMLIVLLNLSFAYKNK